MLCEDPDWPVREAACRCLASFGEAASFAADLLRTIASGRGDFVPAVMRAAKDAVAAIEDASKAEKALADNRLRWIYKYEGIVQLVEAKSKWMQAFYQKNTLSKREDLQQHHPKKEKAGHAGKEKGAPKKPGHK